MARAGPDRPGQAQLFFFDDRPGPVCYAVEKKRLGLARAIEKERTDCVPLQVERRRVIFGVAVEMELIWAAVSTATHLDRTQALWHSTRFTAISNIAIRRYLAWCLYR